jgi:hypothetical protein
LKENTSEERKIVHGLSGPGLSVCGAPKHGPGPNPKHGTFRLLRKIFKKIFV